MANRAHAGSLLFLAVLTACRSPAAVPAANAPAFAAPVSTTVASPSGVASMHTSAAGRIALDDARVYWMDGLYDSEASENAPCRLLSAPKIGGPGVLLASLPTGSSGGIALDDGYVYVGYAGKVLPPVHNCKPGALCAVPDTVHGPTGAVLAVPKNGGPPRILATTRDPAWVTTDGKDVYWADGAELRVGREGGAPTRILDGVTCRALALDEIHVYCQGDHGIVRLPKIGGTLERVAELAADDYTLAIDGTQVYFNDIFQVRRTGPRSPTCNPLQQASCFEPDPWIERISSFTALPKTGGARHMLVPGMGASSIVLDAARAYWITSGRIFKVALTGGAPVEAVANPKVGDSWPGLGLAVDGSALYWVTTSGRIGRAPK